MADGNGRGSSTDDRASLTLVHASPGRVRLKGDLEHQRDAIEDTERAIRALSGVSDVRRNPAAASIVILFDDNAITAERILKAIEPMASVVAQESIDDDLGRNGNSKFGDWVAARSSRADRRVAEASNGAVDLRTLVPAGLFALAARDLLRRGAPRAPWYVLLWYAFDSFIKLRRPAGSGQSPDVR